MNKKKWKALEESVLADLQTPALYVSRILKRRAVFLKTQAHIFLVLIAVAIGVGAWAIVNAGRLVDVDRRLVNSFLNDKVLELREQINSDREALNSSYQSAATAIKETAFFASTGLREGIVLGVDARNESSIWVVGPDLLSTSDDGAETWKPINEPGAPYGTLTDVVFLNETDGWVVGFEGAWHTENGGEDWVHFRDFPETFQPFFVDVEIPRISDSRVVIAASDEGVLQTNDGGNEWSVVLPGNYRDIDLRRVPGLPTDGRGLEYIAVGSNGRVMTRRGSDRDLDWTEALGSISAQDEHFAVESSPSGNWVLVGGTSLYRCCENERFLLLKPEFRRNDEVVDLNVFFYEIDFINENVAYATVTETDGPTNYMVRSDDRGDTWRILLEDPSLDELYKMAVANGQVFVGSDNGLMKNSPIELPGSTDDLPNLIAEIDSRPTAPAAEGILVTLRDLEGRRMALEGREQAIPEVEVSESALADAPYLLIRVGLLALLAFVLQLLVTLYRYSVRLASFYDGRREALILSGLDQKTFKELASIFASDVIDFGTKPKVAAEQIIDLAKDISAKLDTRSGRGRRPAPEQTSASG